VKPKPDFLAILRTLAKHKMEFIVVERKGGAWGRALKRNGYEFYDALS
jgi:hypothetical protein